MKINELTLAELALALSVERKRQGLSREDVAAVCGVSTSFIRDAESNPENCTLGKLAKLINGLGLNLEVSGMDIPFAGLPNRQQRLGSTPPTKTGPGLVAAAMELHPTDFGVPDSQLVERVKGGRPDLLPRSSQPGTGLGLASLVTERGIKNKSKGEPS